MARRSTLAGMEVPITGSDSIKWVELSVADSETVTVSATPPPVAPLTEDCASCSVIGDPPLYVIWRINKNRPRALELLELSANKEFPKIGLRITLPDSLCPFAYICKNEIGRPATPYLLYLLTVSGVAYVFKLRNVSGYTSCSTFPPSEVIEFNLRSYFDNVTITSVAATAGCLVVGRNDGSVACFQLGSADQTAPGFAYELRDDLGMSRLWGFMSRGKVLGAVENLVIQELHGLKLLFVLHSDGILRIWDLSNRVKILNHTMSIPNSEGAKFVRLWVGEVIENSTLIPLAILYRYNEEVSMEMVCVYGLHCSFGDRITLLVETSMQNIPLEEGECVDIKLHSDKIWILKDTGLIFHTFSHNTDNYAEEAHCYALQEEFVAEQLFQTSEHSSNDLILIIHSIFSYTKDHVVPFLSSIFLRRLLQPGVHHNAVLRATFLDYNKHWTDTEFNSLTVGGLKKEICSLIEQEGVNEGPVSVFWSWKNFCTRYFQNWCKHNSPCGFLVQSCTGAIGLVRRNSIALFRDMEKFEVLIDGSDELVDTISFRLDMSDDDSEHQILMEVLRCIISMSQQLGKTASAIFYESLVGRSTISSEEIVPRLLKILETGYSSSVSSLNVSGDFALEKELIDHRNLRKFSIDMLFSLHALSKKADSWCKILNVIESYLQFLVPQKVMQKQDAGMPFDINVSVLVQATSQIAKSMFDSALDILLFVSYLLNISGQINMSPDDISRIQLELVPMIQEIVFEWLIIHFLCTTPSESPAIEDFSSQLSLLQIDGSTDKRSWNEKLGKCNFTLAFILLLSIQISHGDPNRPSRYLPNPQEILCSVRDFTSWIIWGKSGEESNSFLKRSTELALILLRHSQYDAVEYLLTIIEANSRKEKIFRSIQDTDGDWCLLQHLLGCCLLAQARYGFHGILKEKKVCEAVRCFFRASSGQGASQALQDLSHDAGLPYLGFNDCASSAAWKLHYYQWSMQIFEQYGISEGAYQFALAALEQVDEALSQKDDSCRRDTLNESATAIKGRLWANVFKFALDLNHLHDAYCAILSNPDEDSKYICLRRFIIVLHERGGMKVLCGGQIPFIGLAEKIEQELAWKAERSDILTKPNPYKLLYAFEMHRHNWRRAASYIYQYSTRLRAEIVMKDHQHISLVLQERLNGLSAAINALSLVHPAYAWIDHLLEGNSLHNECYPSKKAKKTVKEQLVGSDVEPQRLQFYVDTEKLENEFVLTSAEYLLSLANVKWKSTETDNAPSDLVDLLVQTNLYDMAFTVLLKFWKGSALKKELEKIFSSMSLKCCPNKVGSSSAGNDMRSHGLLLTSSMDDMVVHGSPDVGPASQQSRGNMQWETLELYLEKYKAFHAGLPVTVAETLLRSDPQIELPLWLVHMFKDFRRDRTWGMTGQESNPASLLRLYVDYGRFTEATNLLLEYLELFASVRPSDLVHRKRPFAAWFPYTTMERLWCQLDELINLGHMVDQCEKLKKLLHGALLNHLKLLKVDSDDAISSAAC
ncbi:nuclear pore complex protein NUP160 isoform X1 [Jatropha curcas]|uniref:nuclear pore complex protein NUP160 isoform X1 n=1 Tax=Jatropha curcas TaxID=180498 RepID=UPI0005FAF3C9|nr:nuclear pore complex protein NUP160 isoform X1 [Jatropha curcas]